MQSDSHIFVGRQPIVDRHRRVVAYELLFRASAAAEAAVYEEQQKASVRVIVNTFTTMGVDCVLGDCRGFFNVTAGVLMSDIVEALPRDRVAIEVLENVEVTQELIERCRELKKRGFTIALDDYVIRDPREPLLEWADVVKVDLPIVGSKNLRRLVSRLRRPGLRLLAEKVETHEEFEHCHRLGFDLFQGYFFARPVVLEGASLDSGRLTLMQLLQQLYQQAETEDIVETMKHHVNLGVNLLQLVNSAALATRTKISRIEDAVNYLGRCQLRRWIMILLYAGDENGGVRSPLLQTAAHRGRLMESVMDHAMDSSASEAERERAFLVGMLSLVDVLLSRPISEIVDELNVDDDVRLALLKREGTLGRLLHLVECVEEADFDRVEAAVTEFDMRLCELQEAEDQAYVWVHGLADELAG